MAQDLAELRIAFLVANEGIEEVELTKPRQAVLAAGGRPYLIAPEAGQAQAMHHMDKGDRFEVDLTTADAEPGEFDALVLPGGVANPDQLRTDDDAVAFIKTIFETGKPVAAICHGPWTLVEADVLRGRTLTSWPSLRTDITNAGGAWVDEEVHVSRQGPNVLLTSRKPDDLPAFCDELIRQFSDAATTAPAKR
jgi:protease I